MWHLPRPPPSRDAVFSKFLFFFLPLLLFPLTAELHIHSRPSASSQKPFLVYLRVSAFIAVFRHVPYRRLIERVRVNFSKFSAGISSLFLSLRRSLAPNVSLERWGWKEKGNWGTGEEKERKMLQRDFRGCIIRGCVPGQTVPVSSMI